MNRRQMIARCTALGLTGSMPVWAQEAFPSPPIEMVIPWGAGGGADVLGRIVAKWLENDLKVALPVLNMPGASGMIGLGRMVSKAADGYTISVLTGDSLMMAATPAASVKWADMVTLGVLVRQPSGIFAPPGSRFKTWQDVTRALQAEPGSVTMGITGPNTADDLTVQYLSAAKKLSINGIPYPKPGERYAAVLGGHVDLLYEQAGDVRSYLDSGRLKPLIFFSPTRLAAPFADVPVAGDLGYDILLPQVRAVMIKAGTDAQRLSVLAASVERFALSAEYKAFLDQQLALTDSFIPGKSAQAFLDSELQASRKLLLAYGAK